MSRYIKKVEISNPNELSTEIIAFMQRNGLELHNDGAETFWWKKGLNCTQHITLHSGENCITITAFIRYTDALLGTEHEKTINGWIAGFGKRPLKKIVKKLEKLIKENVRI